MTSPTLVATRDVEEARAAVGKLFCEHRLEPLSPGHTIDMRLRVDQMGPMGLVHLDYGGTVKIAPRPLSTFYLVQIPLAGKAFVEQGGAQITSTPKLASVLSPTRSATMTWQQGNPQRCVYLSRALVENELMRMTGTQVSAPLQFDLGMDLRASGPASWIRTVNFLCAEAVQGGLVASLDTCPESMARTVAYTLLLAQHHNYSDQVARASRAAQPLAQRLVTLIDAHLVEPLGAAEIAEFLSVSVRALRETCRAEFGMTPVALVRERRLLAAREQLQNRTNAADRAVTEAALGVGFTHLGRFAGDYRERFGESPRETVRHRQEDPARFSPVRNHSTSAIGVSA